VEKHTKICMSTLCFKLAVNSFVIVCLLLLIIRPAFPIDTGDIINITHKCKTCHPTVFDQWKVSMHAKAANDPWVISMYNGSNIPGLSLGPSYKGSFPKSTGNCATCHAPDYAIEDPLNTDLNRVNKSMGVSCLFCHFVGRIDVYRDGKFPGVQSIRLKDISQIRQDGDGCLIPRSSLVKKSIICASCHYGKYHDTLVYPSYDEWSKSGSKKSCQDCHFKEKNHQLKIDKSFLSKSIDLKLNTRLDKKYLIVEVAITNTGAGHFYPTGHPIRNMILTIQVWDQDNKAIQLVEGDTVPLYGGDPATDNDISNYSGLPGKGLARILEKVNPISCFNTSVPGANALIGQSLAVEKETRQLFPQEYWKRTIVLEDSRLPPLGTYNQVFRFASGERIHRATLKAKLIYRKAFKPLARYYRWDLKDVIIKEISREVKLENRRELP